MKTIHLFAGIGGGLLADRILGHDPIIAIEWEPYACQVLRERASDGWFPNLQVWEGDVRMFNPSEYAGRVDCIHAGFPCQDISRAGKQAGLGEGTRSGLYREVLRIAGVVRPKYLFLENVSAILTNGLGNVLGDLASLGYDARWCCLKASDVGANHHRDRWWCLATCRDIQRDVAKPNGIGHLHREPKKQPAEGEFNALHNSCSVSEDVAYTYSAQRKGNQRAKRSEQEYADTRAPGWWELEPDVGRVVAKLPFRVERLKGLGNAQVPLQAAAAWKLLGGE